jgi:hypothetical protein
MIPTSVQRDLRALVAVHGARLQVTATFSNFSEGCKDRCITRYTYNNLRTHYEKSGIESEKADFLDYANEDLSSRKRSKRKSDHWVTKEVLFNHYLGEYGITIQAVLVDEKEEKSVRNDDNPFENVIIKSKIVYTVNQHKVNLQRYQNKDTIFYRCVVYHTDGVDSMMSFSNLIQGLLVKVQNTLIVYTHAEYLDTMNWFIRVTRLRQSSSGKVYPTPKPRNILHRDLVYGGILGGKELYSATHKADGQRCFLLMAPNGVWFIDPPRMFVRITRNSGIHQGIVLDGELIPREKRIGRQTLKGYWYLAYDAVAYKGKNDVQQRSHVQRMYVADKVAKAISKNFVITVETKTFYGFKTPSEFFEVMNKMLDDQKLLSYATDGIIFMPEFMQYSPAYAIDPRKDILTVSPTQCKWKPLDEESIDFFVKWIKTEKDGYHPIFLSIEEGKLLPFEGTKEYPFDPVTMIDRTMIEEVTADEVVEFNWSAECQQFRIKGYREDKVAPNGLAIALTIWEIIHDPIYEKDLRGKSDIFMRVYHRRIKRDLYGLIADGANVIDIGSGYGKDAIYWKRYNSIVCIEPNQEAVESLSMNLAINGLSEKSRIIQTSGDDNNMITKGRFKSDHKVDAVTSMFTLGHFWKSKKNMKDFCMTVNQNLKIGGELYFVGIDGYAVEQFYHPLFGGSSPRNGVYKTAKYKMVYDREKRVISINDIQEHLCFINELVEMYNKLKLGNMMHLSWHKGAGREQLLPYDDLRFTRMISYGRIVLIGGNEEDINEEDELESEEQEDELESEEQEDELESEEQEDELESEEQEDEPKLIKSVTQKSPAVEAENEPEDFTSSEEVSDAELPEEFI